MCRRAPSSSRSIPPSRKPISPGAAQFCSRRIPISSGKRVSKKEFVSQAVVGTTTSKRDTAAASVQRGSLIAQKNITAPFAGRLGLRRMERGQYVKAGDPLVWLQSLDPIWIDFPVPEGDLGKLKMGAPIELSVSAYPGQVFKGEIEAFDARVAQDTRTLMVRGRLKNADHKLLPGMFANVGVLEGKPKELVTVPRTAVTYGLYGDSVWVVKEGPPEPRRPQASARSLCRRRSSRSSAASCALDRARATRWRSLRA